MLYTTCFCGYQFLTENIKDKECFRCLDEAGKQPAIKKGKVCCDCNLVPVSGGSYRCEGCKNKIRVASDKRRRIKKMANK